LARDRAATEWPYENLDLGEWRKISSLTLAELGFTSDSRFAGTVNRNQEKYRPLIAALRIAGWSVAPLIVHM
jgi:hypothetical protein